jgi:hypothetical protein
MNYDWKVIDSADKQSPVSIAVAGFPKSFGGSVIFFAVFDDEFELFTSLVLNPVFKTAYEFTRMVRDWEEDQRK